MQGARASEALGIRATRVGLGLAWRWGRACWGASDALAPCTVYSENHIDFQTRFALGSSRIPPSFDRFIVDLAAALKTEPSIAIDISGHTDVSGGDDINVPLSVERALSVANRLVELGIDPTRLRAVGHASTRLCYPDAPRHPGNRRVTIARR
ncbi:MAG: OmpA family protein [Pseudomonadota bacterium]